MILCNTNVFIFNLSLAPPHPDYVPIISKTTPRNTTVRLGLNVTFECRETNNEVEQANMQWLKWNHSFHWGQVKTLDLKNGSYTIVKETPGKYGFLTLRVNSSVPGYYPDLIFKLVIHNVTEDDLGLYTCVACNDFGRVHRSALLLSNKASGQIFSTAGNTTYHKKDLSYIVKVKTWMKYSVAGQRLYCPKYPQAVSNLFSINIRKEIDKNISPPILK